MIFLDMCFCARQRYRRWRGRAVDVCRLSRWGMASAGTVCALSVTRRGRLPMSTPRDYDSTVARIAGNIVAGIASRVDGHLSGDLALDMTQESVALARAIIAEVQRTEPKEPKE